MRTMLWSFAVAAVAALPAGAAPTPPPIARTEALVAAFSRVKADAPAAENERQYARLDGFFDFETLTTRPIAPRADKFTPAQKAEFSERFRRLIRAVAYPDSGAFFRRARLRTGQARASDGVHIVPIEARIPAEDLQTVIEMHWQERGGELRVVDVSFDGDSLVKDYQSQFARIVDREGVAGLLKKLADREAQLAQKEPKKP